MDAGVSLIWVRITMYLCVSKRIILIMKFQIIIVYLRIESYQKTEKWTTECMILS